MGRVSRSVRALALAIMTLGSCRPGLEPMAVGAPSEQRSGDTLEAPIVEPGLPARALLRIGADNLRTGGTPSEIAFSPDGRAIAVAEAWPSWSPGVPFFDVQDGRRLKQLCVSDSAADSVTCVAFSADGTRLLWGESSGNIALWDLPRNRLVYRKKLHAGSVQAVAFSADGTMLASGGDDGAVHLRQVDRADMAGRDFDVGEDRTAPAPIDPAGARCLAFSADGARLIAGAGLSGTIFIWQVSDGQLLRRIEGWAGAIHPENHLLQNIARLDRLTVTPDGHRLISTGRRLGRRPDDFDPRTRQTWVTEIRFWDLDSGECVNILDGGNRPFKGRAAVSQDGKLVALSELYKLQILDVSSGKPVQTIELPGYFPHQPVFSPDGTLLATYHQGEIVLFDVRTGQPLHHDAQTPKGELLAAAWSPSGDRIVTGRGDGEVRLWDARSGKLIRHRLLAPVLNPWGRAAAPNFVAFSHDGQRIIVGGARDQSGVAGPDATGQPGIVAVYDPEGKLLSSTFFPSVISRAALSSDSKIMVAGPPDPIAGPAPDASVLRGIEVATGKTLWTSLPGERPPGLNPLAQRNVTAMCFQLASTALDVALVTGEVVRLDALTGKEQRRFLADWRSPEERQSAKSPGPWMGRAAFSADGRILASTNNEFIHVWDVGTGRLRWSIRRPHQQCSDLALSPDGRTLATADVAPYQGNWGKDAIRLYDTQTGKEVLILDPAGDRTTVLAFSPHGARLLTGFHRTAAIVWDVRRGRRGSTTTQAREP